MTSNIDARAERIRQLAADIRAQGSGRPLDGVGRGVVVVAGGSRVFTNAYVLLRVLRHTLGCALPVELWHFGAEEISPAMAALVEPMGVRLVDANPLIAAAGAAVRDGWQLKAFALVHSGFAEVLLLDADQVPVTNPAGCFSWPEYLETGAVFWPDVIDLRQDNPVWALLGLEPRPGPSFESGQLLVDRRRHAAPLRGALRLNEAAEDIYQLVYGDKDTYLFTWQMLGAPFALVPHRPYVDDYAMVQRDFTGAPLFQHRTQSKWQYGGKQRRISGFRHEEACLAALADLEQRWSGRVFAAPDRTALARQLETQLFSAHQFRLEAADEPAFTITLAPYAEIGAGRAPDRRHWWVEERGGRLTLVLSGGDRRSYELELGADGIWRGQRHRLPIVDIALVPEDSGATISTHDRPGLVDELLRAAGRLDATSPALAGALELLSRTIPGTSDRLRYLADNEPDLSRAELLRALSQSVAAPSGHRDPDRTIKFDVHYTRRGDF